MAILAASAYAANLAYTRALDQTIANGAETLNLVRTGLEGHLARYENLPELIADQDIVKQVLSEPVSPMTESLANLYLEDAAALLGVMDAYVIRPDGGTIAASNHDTQMSFVGRNFRYRPYFQDALAGAPGRFFGIGTTSNKRGYYFSAPVRVGGNILGVVALKIDMDALEASWGSGISEIMVVDPEGAVFMAGRPEWRVRSFVPPGPDAMARTAETRRYADAPLEAIGFGFQTDENGHEVARIGSGADARSYVVLSQDMPDAGWTVKVLADRTVAQDQALAVGVAALLLLALIAALGGILYLRKVRGLERLRLQREAQEQLERRVAERTTELGLANTLLEREVIERRATEHTLRQTQSDLVEAGKLAALGQMSAALSHEFNQPLAAASAYAENALVLIERGRIAEGRANVERIADLMDRLSSISRHLRTFARRPDDMLQEVRLTQVVEDAMTIIGRRVTTADASMDIRIDPAADAVMAVGVRLQQVLVNLISNAADAVEDTPDRRITVTSQPSADGTVELSVEDTGPGVPEAILPRIFDPFFTTKGVGKGLGLGLSISYNIVRDMGGTLHCERGAAGGARFTLSLQTPGFGTDGS